MLSRLPAVSTAAKYIGRLIGEITSLPGGGLTALRSSSLKRQRAPEINVVSPQGITPKHGNPLIFATPTLLGEEKAVLAKCAAVVLCCRLLSLVDRCAGRAGQRVQC